MGDGLRAALRRFPERRIAIEGLIARDEEFRSLCDDLAEAEDVLARWEISSAPHREDRRAEYQALVEGLAEELQRTIQTAGVVPFRPKRK